MKNISYNIVAGIGTGIGLTNTFMTYSLYGVTETADVWNVSLIIITSLTLLSQAGVEQFLPYYSQEKVKNDSLAKIFVTATVYWSILWGMIFGVLTYFSLSVIISLYVDTKSKNTEIMSSIIISLIPLIIFYPLNHIGKALLTIDGKPVKAYIFALFPQISISVALIFGMTIKLQIQDMAMIVGGTALMQTLFSVYIARHHLNITQYFDSPNHSLLKSLIQASFVMRSSHTIHNLLSVMIITKALSMLPAGSISIYQYSKKFADGIFSISTGPHSLKFNSEIAQYWAEKKIGLITATQISFLKNTIPFFITFVLICAFAIEHIMNLIGSGLEISNKIQNAFLFHSIWILLVMIESITVSLLIVRNEFKTIIIVNTIFLMTLYLMTSFLTSTNSVNTIITCAIFAQTISTILFFSTTNRKPNPRKKQS